MSPHANWQVAAFCAAILNNAHRTKPTVHLGKEFDFEDIR